MCHIVEQIQNAVKFPANLPAKNIHVQQGGRDREGFFAPSKLMYKSPRAKVESATRKFAAVVYTAAL